MSTEYKWARLSDDTFSCFVDELQEFGDQGRIPVHGDQDLQYSMELMKRRLEKKQLSCIYRFKPRGYFSVDGLERSWKDERYSTKRESRTCEYISILQRDGKQIYKKKRKSWIHQFVTDYVNGEKVDNDPYTCPNCSAISRIKELRDQGCPYCGTRFKMSELFPKVSGYSLEEEMAGTQREVLPMAIGIILSAILIVTGLMMCVTFTGEAFQNDTTAYRIFYALLVGVLYGGFGGFVLWGVIMLFRLFLYSGKRFVVESGSIGARNRFESEMKKYTPEFSYDYFSNKAISSLRMLLFAENMEQLPNYVGEPLNGVFDHIVSSECVGPVGLGGFTIKDGFCSVIADVYMDSLYYDGRRPRLRRQLFRLRMFKNLKVPMNMYFSIKKIQCKGCGASFDATRQRSCPHCGKRYEIGDDDWVIVKVEKL